MATKTYTQHEEKLQMVNEPAVAYGRTADVVPPMCPVFEDEPEEYSLRPYTIEELHARIDAAEADIAAGRVMTNEEANAETRKLFPWLS